MDEQTCKGCGTDEDVDATAVLCTECIKWGEQILEDCEHRGSRALDEDLPMRARKAGAV